MRNISLILEQPQHMDLITASILMVQVLIVLQLAAHMERTADMIITGV